MNDEHHEIDQAEINANRRVIEEERAGELKKTFTVVGFYEHSSQLCADEVEAKDSTEAMVLAAQARLIDGGQDYILACAMPSAEGLQFPGDFVINVMEFLKMMETA